MCVCVRLSVCSLFFMYGHRADLHEIWLVVSLYPTDGQGGWRAPLEPAGSRSAPELAGATNLAT